MGKKTVFVSDIHLGAKRTPLPGRYQYDWLSPGESDSFADFINHIGDNVGMYEELVILGDMFDTWICPVDEIPPTVKEIAAAHPRVIASLKELEGKLPVLYFPGNHDMEVTENDITNLFGNAVTYGGRAQFNSQFRNGRILAEHGSAYTLFNAPDPVSDPARRLPIGYFISRIVATHEAKTGNDRRHVFSYIDDMLEALGPQTLATSVLAALSEEAGLGDNAKIKMGGATNGEMTIEQAKQKYANIYQQWEQRGSGVAFKALMAEISYLGDIADNLCKSSGTRVVIFGHTHMKEVDKDSWFVDDRIYANCGTWCETNTTKKTPATYVEVEKAGDKTFVSLMKWEDRTTSELEKEYI